MRKTTVIIILAIIMGIPSLVSAQKKLQSALADMTISSNPKK